MIGAGETGAALVDHVDMICVTGSPETGRRVMERASRRLTPVLLELGGKDPMIVLRDADLDRAASAAVWGGCMMTGQVCMSVERVYVEAPVAEAFTAEARREGPRAARRPERPRRRHRLRPVHEPAPDRDRRAPRRGRAREGRRACSPAAAGAASEAGVFFEPTVLAGVDHSMLIMREETFGPVVPIMTVRDADEALRLANDSPLRPERERLDARHRARHRPRRPHRERQRLRQRVPRVRRRAASCPSAASSRAASARATAAPRACGSSACAQAMLVERRRRTPEPTWFPYSPRKARLIERAMGLMFGW